MCNSSKNEDKTKGIKVKKNTSEPNADITQLAEKVFSDTYRNSALAICFNEFDVLYSGGYANAIINTALHVEKCTDHEYSKYLNSDEFNPEYPRSRHDIRMEVISKGYHLFMAKCNQKGYEDLCESIGKSVFEIEDLCYDSQERIFLADIGDIKEVDHELTYRDAKYCVESIIIAHLMQIGTFCDLLESITPKVFWLHTAEVMVA